MNAAINSLTPAEAAVVAGVSMRDVHRVIDEHILPEGLYDVRGSDHSEAMPVCISLSTLKQPAG